MTDRSHISNLSEGSDDDSSLQSYLGIASLLRLFAPTDLHSSLCLLWVIDFLYGDALF